MADLFNLSSYEKIGLYLLIAILFVIVLKYWITNKITLYKHIKRIKRGAKGEIQAEKLLIKNGYSILSKQEEFVYTLKENDNIVSIKVVPDFIAKKNGKRYVVEVKTGSSAPSITNSSTRRQILEYYHVFDCDGVILLDMEACLFKHIDFGEIKQKQKYPIYAVGLTIIAFMGILFSSILIKITVCIALALSMYFYVRK